MLSQFLDRMLRVEGFAVECVFDGEAALRAVRRDVDLLMLDLNLPLIDGMGVLSQLRPRFPKLPVLVLTARGRAESTVQALESGADDCLQKPFSYAELLARIRALLRRSGCAPHNTSQCADLLLDREKLSVKRGDRRIDLTQREYSLLEYLMRTPGTPVSRVVLLQEIWGAAAADTSTNVVDVYMKYVRDKVDLPGLPKLIRTVRGTGYAVSES